MFLCVFTYENHLSLHFLVVSSLRDLNLPVSFQILVHFADLHVAGIDPIRAARVILHAHFATLEVGVTGIATVSRLDDCLTIERNLATRQRNRE